MPFLDAALAKAVTIPSATIHQHVAQLRRRNPEATPAQLIRLLEKEYLLVVQGAGGAVGAAAAAPAVGTGVAVVLTASDVATFFGASAAFALAVASVHGIEVEDADRRTALLLSTILGEPGAAAVRDTVELNGSTVARLLLTRMPLATVKKVNSTLTRRMVRTQVAKQTGVAIGRLIPYGIGVVVGITGARALGRTVIRGSRAAFGPAPVTFPQVVEIGPGATRTILPPPKGPSRLRSLTSRRTSAVPEQNPPTGDS
ncbi:hypothetical protein Cch01nite_34150 [Cellulomonas chitinilytica]|uniref:EcsC family protein n=1 Tax=Cellulomonas chitinilytica TaxID=398759 RepID=A0A919P3E3_9CELL|nr:hypothetical protein [Cellulomonas chitinilytica]GIG22691.1 hypothetical protein Cch01nite_34150 [Cellulomonas chitinilytica]